MAASFGNTLVKVLVPLAGIAVLLLVTRRREGAWRADLGVRAPDRVASGVLLYAAYVAWMLGTDRVMGWRGPWDFSAWARTPLPTAALRVLAVAVIGPVLEELVVRGLVFTRIARTRLGAPGAIVATAAGWSVLHTAYTPAVVGILFVSGLILAAARHRTGSLLFPVLMHVTWNLFAVW